MSRDQKIEKINAYRKMLESKRLPKVEENQEKDSLSVEGQIHAEFNAWVEGQLSVLLGEGSNPVSNQTGSDVSDVFTDEQIGVLQTFADKMLNKAAPGSAAPAAPPQRQAPTNEGYRSPREVKPLGNRRMDQDSKKASSYDKETNKTLSKLEKMDREGPQY